MQPTIEILERIRKNSNNNKDEIFTRLYRYLLRPDIYYVAYKNLYANSGASTIGVEDDTADGFSIEKIERIIQSLADESYSPKPARRVYIPKSNGKTRPLGIPTFTDKLVQEVLRMILEAVYEPVFLDYSHGYRPKRSCHTALVSAKNHFTGVRWFIEGDIKGCFDNINHQVLVGVINDKIKDARLIKLMWKMLKAGYLENWKYNNTYSGTPQGGIVSPIFANIYLHELDKYVEKLATEFEKPRKQLRTTEYLRISAKLGNVWKKFQRPCNQTPEKIQALLTEKKMWQAELRKVPCVSQTDKKITYIRYADDFLVGVKGNKEDCQEIKQRLSEFISQTLKMELSEEKTLITHSNEYARFLGYDVRVRRDNNTVKPCGNKKQRTLNNTFELCIPLKDKIERFLFDNAIVKQKKGKLIPVHRTHLLHLTDLEIVNTYNAELRGIGNYYSLASNFCKLNYFAYLMEYSCLKTLANKHKTSIGKIKTRYKDGTGRWGIPYQTKEGNKRMCFTKIFDCKTAKGATDVKANVAVMHAHSATTFESRLNARVCELCGTTTSERYEIHHVNKVKNLKGKVLWERIMIAKRRKTLVVCQECHHKIHGKRVLND